MAIERRDCRSKGTKTKSSTPRVVLGPRCAILLRLSLRSWFASPTGQKPITFAPEGLPLDAYVNNYEIPI